MKARTTILIPLAFGLMIAGCTSSSRQQTESLIDETTSSAESVSQTPQNSIVSEKEIKLEKELASKSSLINSLQQKLADNKKQLASLNISLDEKDAIIANLQNTPSSAKSLAALEEQKKQREMLEARYAALKLDNNLLTRRIGQLENENTSLKQQVSTLENMPTTQDGFKQSYFNLLDENTQLQGKYANLESDNQANQKRLAALKKENLMLGGALSEARAQHQVLWDKIHSLGGDDSSRSEKMPQLATSITQPVVNDNSDYERQDTQMQIELADLKNQLLKQKALVDQYKSDILELEADLDEGANFESRWKELDNKLAQAQQKNAALTAQLNALGEELNASQTELSVLSARLASTKQELETKENSGISVTAAIEALQLQMSSSLHNVQWELPNEIALHDNFEILVSADVRPSLSEQAYQAELVTDSDIQMISDKTASAVVQNGRLQWRWRVAGLNEKPEAQLNLFVSQQISFQNQTIQRQVYRGNETLSLINTNLFEKYGYWGGAILLGLLGGFLVGRMNKSKSNQDLNV
ncbi:hypothetical protein EBI01_04170 [Marinomonas rhizomae]|uniref:Chromosome partition protein Smc n=1 Tax=Marinomonas rhizomae TaxID=491948 RepID=A0A366JCF9_9GAMM|nr:hypothetical protein [Marinomonas rhizomae]RBP84666.1 hypothetical protein DFP80_103136 [Marinomonas rhizomae]RNF75129.1 hypothetical protein EBI01_04170 [Marinomonas rhizomae]